MGSFQTSDGHKNRLHRPLRVPTRKEHVHREAAELLGFLDGWEVLTNDVAGGTITCRRKGTFLTGTATVVVTIEGSEEHPTTTVNVRSTTQGGLLSRDKANVSEFMTPFTRRVV